MKNVAGHCTMKNVAGLRPSLQPSHRLGNLVKHGEKNLTSWISLKTDLIFLFCFTFYKFQASERAMWG